LPFLALLFGILERVVYCWKGMENTFPRVCYVPPNPKIEAKNGKRS